MRVLLPTICAACLALPVAAPSTVSAKTEMSKDQCGTMVDGTKAIADQLKRMDIAFAKLEMKKNAELTAGEVFDSAQRVEAARQKVLASLREYESAADELSERLHSCAGVAKDSTRNETPTDAKGFAPLYPKQPPANAK